MRHNNHLKKSLLLIMDEEEKLLKHNSIMYWKNIFRIFIISLITLLALYLLVKAELLFYFVFTKLVYLFLKPFPFMENESVAKIIFYMCIIIQIYLHIVLSRYCVLSLIFLMGGFMKNFFIYHQFTLWITFIINQITPLLTLNDGSQISNYRINFKHLKSFQKVFNQMVLTNQSFETKQNKFGNYLNEVMYIYHQSKSKKNIITKHQLSQLNTNADNLISSLDTYLNYTQMEILFKFNYFKVLAHLNAELLNDLKNRNALNINIAPDFPAILLSPGIKSNEHNYISTNNSNNNKTLIVFCNQNAVCCEFYHLSKENFQYYLSLPNTSILLWNYKGFGLRKGMTTFESIDYDTQRLANYIKNEFPSRTKVVIHGISIGGFAAVRLANAMNDPKNVLLIADRTMSSIDAIIRTLPYGFWLSLLFNTLFPRILFNSSNIDKYINVHNKMILYDEKDEVIPSSANLITNVTYSYFNDVLKKPIEQFLNKKIESISALPKALLNEKEITELRNELLSLLNKSNLSSLFINTFLKYMNKCSLEIFLLNYFSFGFPFNVFKEIPFNAEDMSHNYSLIPLHLQRIVNDNKQNMSALFIKFISVINSIYVNVLLSFNDISQEQLNTFSYDKTKNFKLKDNIKDQLLNYFGYTKRLFCGHNGKLTDIDNEYIQEYLEANDFIQNQNKHQIN